MVQNWIASFSVLLAAPEDSEPAGAADVLDVLGVLAVAAGGSGVLADELVLDELPHPVRRMSPRAAATAARMRIERALGLPCELIVTV